jgi:hypothetical protein
MNTIHHLSTFQVPLTKLAHQSAQHFYHQHSEPQKAKQVYLNTLAVYAVNYYLQCFGIETDLEASDSYNPILQTLANVGDLVVKNKGKIECRSVLPNSQTCWIPAEVRAERIGYIAVQFNATLTEANLLGFVPQVTNEELPLSQLQSLEDLLEHLTCSQFLSSTTHLLQWVDNIFAAGWQSLEDFLAHSESLRYRLATRSTKENLSLQSNSQFQETWAVSGTKLIDLGIQLEGSSICLLIALVKQGDEAIGVQVQLYPEPSKQYLTPDLQLALLAETGEKLTEVISRSQDNWIQLPYFQGLPGETFSIKITLNHVSLVENFILS